MLSNILLQIQEGAEAATTIVQTEKTLNIIELAVKGGWIMLILGVLSIVAVYIFVERYLALNKAGKEDKNFMNNLKMQIHQGNLEGAKQICASNSTPIGAMMEKGISRLGRPLNDINQAVENVGKLEIARLENGVSILGAIANLAPSLGFLGTVT